MVPCHPLPPSADRARQRRTIEVLIDRLEAVERLAGDEIGPR
jgi:hypothetical protein